MYLPIAKSDTKLNQFIYYLQQKTKMPFNPIHFEPPENGFLLVFKPSSLVINKPEYLLTCRGLLEDELKDKGYEMTDGATAVDGSDAQVWFEYPPQTKRSDELIALHVLRAINRINRTIYKQFHVKDRCRYVRTSFP